MNRRSGLPGMSAHVAVIICSRRRKAPPCYRDNLPATIQCDAIVGRKEVGCATNVPVTYDRWCCDKPSCSMKVGPNRHKCRAHYDAATATQPRTPGGIAR